MEVIVEDMDNLRGRYHMQWWEPHYMGNHKLTLHQCQFWPEIWTLREDRYLGE